MRKLGSQIFQFIKKSILLILLLYDVDSALVEFPNNVVTRYGDGDATFKCKSDHPYELKWFIQPNGTAQRQILANGKQVTPYCTIKNDEPGEFILILKIQDESAQTYTCHEPTTNEERSVELVIIEPVKFEKAVNESHVTLNCSFNFRGNWAPELELSHNGTLVVKGVEVFVVPNQNVSTTLVIPCNDSACVGNYSCTARFHLRGKPKQTTDNSVPSYMDTSILTVHMEEILPGTRSDSNSKGFGNIVIPIVCTVVAVVLVLLAVGFWRYWHYSKNKREGTQRSRDIKELETFSNRQD